jgi:deoxyribose-phosphate aldolase
MIDAGASRIGASAGVAIVRELGAPEFTPRTKG